MKYAYKNGKILNGTKDMQVQTGLIILTEGEKIAAIVPEETRLSGYTEGRRLTAIPSSTCRAGI